MQAKVGINSNYKREGEEKREERKKKSRKIRNWAQFIHIQIIHIIPDRAEAGGSLAQHKFKPWLDYFTNTRPGCTT